MLVVGASLARAFGIVGAAGRGTGPRLKIPKDAGVMLSTLAVGLAACGCWRCSPTGFILVVLGIIESLNDVAFGSRSRRRTRPPSSRRVEQLMRRAKLDYEMRTTAEDELGYDVEVPLYSMEPDCLPDYVTKIDFLRRSNGKREKEKKEKK